MLGSRGHHWGQHMHEKVLVSPGWVPVARGGCLAVQELVAPRQPTLVWAFFQSHLCMRERTAGLHGTLSLPLRSQIAEILNSHVKTVHNAKISSCAI